MHCARSYMFSIPAEEMHNQNKRRQTDEQICCCCREDEFQKDKEAIKRDKDEETEKESELMG